MPEILSLNNVTFSYTPEIQNSRNAVENVSFAVDEGEWIAIVGHNGSGKSTIAKLMNGLLFPQQGDVRILREPLNEENLWESRSLMGMVFKTLTINSLGQRYRMM